MSSAIVKRQTTATGSASRLAEMPAVTAVTLALAMGALPALSIANSAFEMPRALSIAIRWAVAFAVVGIALGVEELSPASIGFRRPAWIDLGYLLGTAAVALLIFVLADPVVEALGLPLQAGSGGPAAGSSLELALAAAITVGVVEELLYRGYAIERLLDYSGSAIVAGGLTWAAFTLAHAIVWPLGNLIQIAAVTAVFVAVYLRRRTLFPVAGAHTLVWILPVLEQFFA